MKLEGKPKTISLTKGMKTSPKMKDGSVSGRGSVDKGATRSGTTRTPRTMGPRVA